MDKEDKYPYKNVKVKPETWKRLRVLKNTMELQALESGEEETYSMDRVIDALINFLDATEIKFDEKEE